MERIHRDPNIEQQGLGKSSGSSSQGVFDPSKSAASEHKLIVATQTGRADAASSEKESHHDAGVEQSDITNKYVKIDHCQIEESLKKGEENIKQIENISDINKLEKDLQVIEIKLSLETLLKERKKEYCKLSEDLEKNINYQNRLCQSIWRARNTEKGLNKDLEIKLFGARKEITYTEEDKKEETVNSTSKLTNYSGMLDTLESIQEKLAQIQPEIKKQKDKKNELGGIIRLIKYVDRINEISIGRAEKLEYVHEINKILLENIQGKESIDKIDRDLVESIEKMKKDIIDKIKNLVTKNIESGLKKRLSNVRIEDILIPKDILKKNKQYLNKEKVNKDSILQLLKEKKRAYCELCEQLEQNIKCQRLLYGGIWRAQNTEKGLNKNIESELFGTVKEIIHTEEDKREETAKSTSKLENSNNTSDTLERKQREHAKIRATITDQKSDKEILERQIEILEDKFLALRIKEEFINNKDKIALYKEEIEILDVLYGNISESFKIALPEKETGTKEILQRFAEVLSLYNKREGE